MTGARGAAEAGQLGSVALSVRRMFLRLPEASKVHLRLRQGTAGKSGATLSAGARASEVARERRSHLLLRQTM